MFIIVYIEQLIDLFKLKHCYEYLLIYTANIMPVVKGPSPLLLN